MINVRSWLTSAWNWCFDIAVSPCDFLQGNYPERKTA